VIAYHFLPPAEEEMHEAAKYYEEQAEGLGEEFLDDVQRSIDSVRMFPEIGSMIEPPLRRHLLSRFPYSVVYAREPETIVVVAIAHHRRRPGYWRERLES
jgi:plasmid stabilization system protein ParE